MRIIYSAVFFLCIIFYPVSILSQISSGGAPLTNGSVKFNSSDNLKVLNYETDSKLKQQAIASMQKHESITFAHGFEVDYTPQNSGNWRIIGNYRVWQLEITSPGAYSINLIFDRYVLPNGAKLFLYNKDRSDVKGAFTSANNKKNGVLATSPIVGDAIIVEYQEPLDADFEGELLIGSVNHDYVGILKYNEKVGWFGDSQSCNVNVSCSDIDGVEDIKRGVMRMIINGTEYCTATLINNTSDTKLPYVITAGHCFTGDPFNDKTVFLFNYETPHCSSVIEGDKSMVVGSLSVSGADMKCIVTSKDYALLELSEMPPKSYRPYFVGWSLVDQPIAPFAAIHHPNGDVKKISTALNELSKTTFYSPPFDTDMHWHVEEWDSGTTEGGSSGCGLFDANNLLIGTLSGGAASCANSVNDYFVRFNRAWDSSTAQSNKLKTYLDPDNTGAQSISGIDPYGNDAYDRISNVEYGNLHGNTRPSDGFGYITGHNATQIKKYAEKFGQIKKANLRGCYIMPSKYVSGSSQSVKISVYTGNETPLNLKYEKEFMVGNLKSNKELYIDFDSDIYIEGNFFVSYELEYASSVVDTFSVYHTVEDRQTKVSNTMMLEDNGEWKLASDYYGIGNTSLWIDALVDIIESGDTSITPTPDGDGIVVKPNPFTTNSVHVCSNDYFVKRYELYSVNGQKLDFGEVGLMGCDIKLDFPALPSGLYILKLYTDSKTFSLKIVKQIKPN